MCASAATTKIKRGVCLAWWGKKAFNLTTILAARLLRVSSLITNIGRLSRSSITSGRIHMTIVKEGSFVSRTMMPTVLLAFWARCKDTPINSEIHLMKSCTTACLTCVWDSEIWTPQFFFLDRWKAYQRWNGDNQIKFSSQVRSLSAFWLRRMDQLICWKSPLPYSKKCYTQNLCQMQSPTDVCLTPVSRTANLQKLKKFGKIYISTK